VRGDTELSRDEIFREVREILTVEFGLSPADIDPSAHLTGDLDLDSIDVIDLASQLEERTGIALEDEELRGAQKLGELVDVIAARAGREIG